jgi:hypothetical protein
MVSLSSESTEKILYALLITQILKNDYINYLISTYF